MRRHNGVCLTVLLLFAILPQAARANIESRWGAQEFYTRKAHLRYLLLFPQHYDPQRKYELWLSLHGNPGCAEQGIYFYFPEAQQREVFLLAPQGTGDAAESYRRPDGTKGVYRFLDMQQDRTRILAILFAGPMFKSTARRLRQYGFELRTAYPAGVGHAIPPAIKMPLIAFMDEVRTRQRPKQPLDGRDAHPQRHGLTGNGYYCMLAVGILTGGLFCLILARRHRKRRRRQRLAKFEY